LGQASARANCNFDSLFVPFRCLAADIFTQQQILLKDGNLSDAVRATLNVPLFFKPVRVQNKFLFDGGIYNNFPVDWAEKEFKPDVIIGVNVSSKNFQEYPYNEDDKLMDNALLYLFLSKSDSSQIDSTGIFIQPKMQGMSALEFDRLEEFENLGYRETISKMSEIKAKIARRLPRENLIARRQQYRASLPTYQFGEVNIVGVKYKPDKYIGNMFYYRSGRLNYEEIKKKYFRLAEADKFEVLYPNFNYNEATGKYDFQLRVKPSRDLRAEIGGNLASRSISTLYLGLEYDYLSRFLYTFAANFYSGRFYRSTHLRIRINIATKVPIFFEPEFIFNDWDYLNITDLLVDQGKEQVILKQNDTKFGFNMGVAAGRVYRFLFSAAHFITNDKYNNTALFTSNNLLDVTRFEGQSFTIQYGENSLNRRVFASKGSRTTLSGRFVQGFENHTPGTSSVDSTDFSKFHQWLVFKLSAERYFSLGKFFTLGLMLEAVNSTQPLFRNYVSALIMAPAFNPMVDSRTLFLKNFRNYAYIAAGGRAIFHFSKNLELRFEAYLFNAFEPLRETPNQNSIKVLESFDPPRLAGLTALVFHTRLGPLSAHVNYYDNPTDSVTFLLNFGYIIFNKKVWD
jgi:NTE family protein